MTSTVLTLTMNPAVDVSASTEKVVPTDKLRCRGTKRDPGGGGINVARVLTRLGSRCRAVYPAGGAPGRVLQDLLAGEAIESMAIEVAADTRESFSVFEQASGEQYRFVLSGDALREADWIACLDAVAGQVREGDFIVASGSLPPGVPIDFYAHLATRLAGAGVRLVVDSSGPVLKAALGAGIHLAKPNLNELRELTGAALSTRTEWERAASDLVENGAAEIVVLSLGADGAFLASKDLCLRADPIPVEAVSAVGAGDSFLAGLVGRLAAGAGIEEGFRHGIAAGSAALLTPGTDLCHKPDVERLLGLVRLERPA